jgi:predicted NBD/HSP70 family sugar kinase
MHTKKPKLTMTPTMTKTVNKRLVLDHLLEHNPTSRAEISRQLQLSKPTVSLIIAELIEEGLVKASGHEKIGLGRPSVKIELNPSSRYAIGIELGASVSRIIVTDMLAHPLDTPLSSKQLKIDVSTPESAAVGLATNAQDFISELLTDERSPLRANGHTPKLVGIGIGVPAVVNSLTKEIVGSNPLNWSGPTPFGQIIENILGTPVFLTQRVLAAAWAERIFGYGRNVNSLVYVRFGSGVASGIILSDQLYLGTNSFAGDIANMAFLPRNGAWSNDPPLTLQSLATRSAITARARELFIEGAYTTSSVLDEVKGNLSAITLEMLCMGAINNDPLSRHVIVESARYVGIAIANIIGLLNPPLIVIGGPLAQAGAVLLEAARDQVQRCVNRHALSEVEIRLSGIGDAGPALGAASLSLKHFLNPAFPPYLFTGPTN